MARHTSISGMDGRETDLVQGTLQGKRTLQQNMALYNTLHTQLEFKNHFLLGKAGRQQATELFCSIWNNKKVV